MNDQHRVTCWKDKQSLILCFGFLSLLICFYAGLGAYGLLNNNEGLYASIGQAMLQTGNYSIPHLNGVPYIEKPPLLYWLSAISYAVFGVHEFSARFWPATAGLVTCLTVYGFGCRLQKKQLGLMGAWILATSIGFIIFSRTVFFDGLLTCFLTLAFVSFYFFYTTEQRKYLRWSYTCLALAVLTKGLVAGVLFALVILVFLSLEYALIRFWKKLFDPLALLLFIGIALPWHVWASIQEPGFAWFYIINEHMLRFLNLREPQDYYRGSFFYYLPRLAAYFMPWTLLLGAVFIRNPVSAGVNTQASSLRKFLWCWFLVPLVFFSFSHAKANYYMMLGMPALAFSVAIGLDRAIMQRGNKWLWGGLVGSSLINPLILGVLIFFFVPQQGVTFNYFAPLTWVGMVVLLISIGVFGYSFLRSVYAGALIAVGATSLGLLMILISVAADNERYFSSKPLASMILKEHVDTVYLYQDFEMLSSLAFYLNRPLVMVDSKSSDLWYGQQVNPKVFLDIDQFKAQLKSTQRIYVIARRHNAPNVQKILQDTPFYESFQSIQESAWKNFKQAG